jgi:hypothetical protein
MKKNYLSPTMMVVKLQHQGMLMDLSMKGLGTNLTDGDAIIYCDGGNGDARTKEFGSIWDEEW